MIWEKDPGSLLLQNVPTQALSGLRAFQQAPRYSSLPTSQSLNGDSSPAPRSEMSQGHLSQEELEEGPMKYLLPPSGGSGLAELQTPTPAPTPSTFNLSFLVTPPRHPCEWQRSASDLGRQNRSGVTVSEPPVSWDIKELVFPYCLFSALETGWGLRDSKTRPRIQKFPDGSA